ncbi:MAG: AfsR/SARP family transcriptional regulator [Streptosporangiaceae bacterium]|nr:AfsR/SARP family transcriptional regulator [Streptosporangiaceae bacterium]
MDLELALGRHRELTGELRTLTSEWPLRERLAAQLMLAPYRSGRHDEALDAYRSLTRRLADDLGLDPSPAVAALHEAILGHVGEGHAAVGELIGQCARLPLALAIAAARAAARPALALAQLAAELRQPVGPLDALDTGDHATSLRAVFSWSLRTMPAGPARLFVLLGQHPGPDFDAYAAAALAGTTFE